MNYLERLESRLLVEKLLQLRNSPPKESAQYRDACFRASRIASVFNFLLEKEILNPANLRGRVADLGTGSGGGALAVNRFGAKEVIGVDDCLGSIGGIGVEDAIPSQTVFKLPGTRHQIEKVQDFLANQQPDSFDLVTAFFLPPFRFPAPPELCHMSHSLLKPGGQIVISEKEEYMLSVWEKDQLLEKNSLSPIEIVFNGENSPWWEIDQFNGRLFFLPVLRQANNLVLEKTGKLVFDQEESDNELDREVFIGTKL